MTFSRYLTLCKQKKVNLTTPRRKVLEILYKEQQPLTAYEILRCYQIDFPTAQAMTVYRVLDFLLQHQLIHKVHSESRFSLCQEPYHAHIPQLLICEQCHHVTEVESSTMRTAAAELETLYQFKASLLPLEIKGTCLKCQE